MTDTERINLLEVFLKAGFPVGLKPGGIALIGQVYIEGADSLRDLIDKIDRINKEEEPVPDDTRKPSEKESSGGPEDKG